MPPPHHPGSQRKQRDSKTVSYAYDNSGNLATVTDSETGIVITYYYDLLNRQSGYREQGTNLEHTVRYEYNEDNNLSSMAENISGATKTYSYTYDDDNRIISETVDGVTVEYTYDGFGRLETRTVKQGETTIQTSTPTYAAGSAENTTTGQISSYNGYTYTYDKNGNILTISDGTNTISYEYDSANQLIRENNQAQGFTHTWTYDNAGNIQSSTEYAYTTVDALETITPTDMVIYGYTDENWGDLLTSYDGKTITYDNIGNPEAYDGWTYTWKHGRQLVSMTDGTTTWNYTYGADGLRTKRTNGTDTYTYVYNGSQLTVMTKGDDTLQFTYDASGTPLAVIYNGVTYYYHTNLQGDILGIKDGSGNAVVTYAYDAWGNLLSNTGSMANSLGIVNPLRYRGYVYDSETGLYYLQSRYYNPEWGRFINADAYVATGQGLLGNNMLAYCGNNPANCIDPTGEFLEELWNGLTQAVQQASTYFLTALGITQIDSPVPGPADAVGAAMIIGGLVYCAGQAIHSAIASVPNYSFNNSGILSSSTEDDLTGIATSFGVFACVEASEAMAAYLRKNGKKAEIITLTYTGVRPFIWCESKQTVISTNGIHMGLAYNGIIYCNVHPLGLPETLWLNDFMGTGQRIITRIPI